MPEELRSQVLQRLYGQLDIPEGVDETAVDIMAFAKGPSASQLGVTGRVEGSLDRILG